jgi:peptide deformylase
MYDRAVKLKIVQAGDPVLRMAARPLTPEQVRSREIQELIDWMRETMYDAPGVGLAAPQVGLPVQLAVMEDRADLLRAMDPQKLAERRRRPVPFQVLINPVVRASGEQAEFFEGCLSFSGYSALVARPLEVEVDCLDHRGEAVSFRMDGWPARIVQHETDHLRGVLYVDRMRTQSLTTMDNLTRYWNELPVSEVVARLAGGEASHP